MNRFVKLSESNRTRDRNHRPELSFCGKCGKEFTYNGQEAVSVGNHPIRRRFHVACWKKVEDSTKR